MYTQFFVSRAFITYSKYILQMLYSFLFTKELKYRVDVCRGFSFFLNKCCFLHKLPRGLHLL